MMEQWLQDIIGLLPGGAIFIAAVFVIAFLEALIGIGLIMPGSVLTVFSGWLAFQGKAPIIWIMLAAAAGAMIGDILSYWFGARLGPRVRQWRLLEKRKALLRLTEVVFLEHGGKSVFFGRFLGPIRGLVPFVAGASQMPPASFVVYVVISSILWGISYPGLGYLGGTSWQYAETLAGRLGLLIALAFVVTIIATFLRHRYLPQNPSTLKKVDSQEE